MQLKLKRSQRNVGLMGGKVLFALDARADLTAEERGLVNKYGLGKLVVYDSEARKRNAAAASEHFDGAAGSPVIGATAGSTAASLWRSARGAARAAMSALTLRVTVDSLAGGQHIECKDLDELMGAEAAILDACKNVKAYLETALTFDGREEVLDF
ncbi:MAG: hypothetical protein JO001_14190 [Alphaproteobacteria bacterium]|nr:hypothetical protein [Alphaproteobacteria bacterium]